MQFALFAQKTQETGGIIIKGFVKDGEFWNGQAVAQIENGTFKRGFEQSAQVKTA